MSAGMALVFGVRVLMLALLTRRLGDYLDRSRGLKFTVGSTIGMLAVWSRQNHS